MNKARLEAFTDGVIAVIITIMVLEMKVPHGVGLEALAPIVPVFLSYVLSFVYVGIYWNNHHHMFHAVHRVTGGALWANMHRLFWLSLVPFVTGWKDGVARRRVTRRWTWRRPDARAVRSCRRRVVITCFSGAAETARPSAAPRSSRSAASGSTCARS